MVSMMDGMEPEDSLNYKQKYRNMKKKLKLLIYENECFQEELRKTQRKLLKVNRDKSFLLDRLLQYEKVEASSSDSENTESSEGEMDLPKADAIRKRKLETSMGPQAIFTSNKLHGLPIKKKKAVPKLPKPTQIIRQPPPALVPSLTTISDGHMTPEEVERHLESRQNYLDLVPEKAPLTVPNEMFSNEASLDSESNELLEDETSPSNLGDDSISVDLPE